MNRYMAALLAVLLVLLVLPSCTTEPDWNGGIFSGEYRQWLSGWDLDVGWAVSAKAKEARP